MKETTRKAVEETRREEEESLWTKEDTLKLAVQIAVSIITSLATLRLLGLL